MASLSVQEIVSDQTAAFAKIFSAFQECDSEIRAVIEDMVAIVTDPESTEEERAHATDTMVEALFPSLTVDILEHHRKIMQSDDGKRAREEVATAEAKFADRLRECMEKKGITQQELAQKAGIGQPAIANMLKRQCRPQQRTVARFAEALGVSPDELWPCQES